MGTTAAMPHAETPILDGRAPMPPARKPGAFAAGLLTGFVFAVATFGALVLTNDLALTIVAVYATRYVQVVVHEAGHLVAGLLAGFRFQSLTVWPFDVLNAKRGVRLRFDRKPRQSMTMMVPPLSVSGRRLAVFHAGGVAANALCAVAAATAFALSGAQHSLARLAPGPHAVASMLEWLTALIGTQLAISNLVPARERIHPSDGAQIADDLAENARFRRGRAIARLARAVTEGSALSPMADDLAAARTPDDGSRPAMRGHLFAYYATGETDRTEAAADLERALASSAFAHPSERRTLLVEAVAYAAYERRDLEQTRRWHERCAAESLAPSERLRISAALAFASGDHERAIAEMETLQRELPRTIPDARARAPVEAAAAKMLALFREHLAARDGEPAP